MGRGGGRLSTSGPSLTSVKDDWGSFSPKMCTNTLRGIAQQDHNRVELVIKYSVLVTYKGFTTLLINGSKKVVSKGRTRNKSPSKADNCK